MVPFGNNRPDPNTRFTARARVVTQQGNRDVIPRFVARYDRESGKREMEKAPVYHLID